MSRLNLWYLPPAFFSQAGHGCGQRPAFPAPSACSRGTNWSQASGRTCRENAKLCRSLIAVWFVNPPPPPLSSRTSRDARQRVAAPIRDPYAAADMIREVPTTSLPQTPPCG